MPAYDAQHYHRRGKEKTRSKIAATPATNLLPYHGSKTSYYSGNCCGFECQYQLAPNLQSDAEQQKKKKMGFINDLRPVRVKKGSNSAQAQKLWL